jgi:8-oxo-dGTP pyrophosphatase MutT (NUDIX family)
MDHRTAMPSRNHPEPPEGLRFTTGIDPYEYENEQTHPGWAHRQIYAHLPGSERGRPDGILNYSATPDGHPHPTVAIHMIKTYGDRGRGVGSAMMDELRGQHPAHMFDHGAKSPSGQAFLDKYEDPAGPHMNLDHPANAALEDLHRPTDEAKWRARKNLDFMGILRTAARDRELGFEVTASWADVQRKAKRIRAEGGVTIVIASNDGIGGQVKGDKHTYEAILVFRPGTHKVADWTCGCAWAAYAFDRSPAFKHFEGRKCSHALALQFEAQSQGMFGKEIHPAEPARTVPTVVKYDPDNGQSVFARPYEGSLAAVAVAHLRADDVDPAEIIGTLIQTGMKHAAARELWKTAHVEEGHHEAALDMVDAGELGPVLAAKEDTPGPTVSGIALKAHDTGRVLMLQRGLEDEKDPAAGTWEMPGGHHESGDLTSLHAGIREFEEEVGQEFPLHGVVKHTWTSPNGVYQGHVVVIPSEKDLSMKDGRVVPNPDDPKGDHHEQAAWWSVEHAKKIPNLRPEVKANTPWKEIERASLDTAKTASSWDPISNTTVSQPGRNLSEPEHSTSKNPVSTGFATSDDPSNWDNLDASPTSLTTNMSFDSTLHAQPEPALPSTDGGAEYHPEFSQEDLDPVPDDEAQPDPYQSTPGITLQDGGSATPNTYHSSRTAAEIVADFQKSAAAQALMMPTDADADDIAAAARSHLSKSALTEFSPAEQRELINEGAEDARARNFGDLKIDGTHYALLEEAMLNGEVDPSGLFL